MCGIVGYVGFRDAPEFLVSGLRRLEYRGYDSSGIVTIDSRGDLTVRKAAGRLDRLTARLADKPLAGRIGIGHTRWATHGAATDDNAHPHIGGDGVLAVAHNGVIENYRQLKEHLEAVGYRFRSQTDSEVIAHLIAECLEKRLAENGESTLAVPEALRYGPLIDAVSSALAQLQGTYGLAIVFRDYPDVIIAARHGSPIVLGIGEGEHFIASDASPLAGFTDKIVYLAEHELAVVTADALRVIHRDDGEVRHHIHTLDIDAGDVELLGHQHYMHKEIFEQCETLENTMRGRLSLDEATAHFGGLNLTPQQLRGVNRLVMTACGTSWHAAMVGEYLMEEFARIPVEVEYASELRYRNPPIDAGTLVFAITQSGETADTLAALREMKRQGHPTLAICNVVGSTIAQEADGGIYLHAGPEIGVASTKAFTSQCAVLTMLALYFGRLRHLNFSQGMRIIEQLQELPEKVRQALATDDQVRRIAEKYHQCTNFLYLGRQYNFPTALEGALKLKEISYIHAEGYPAAEMKHGPIALIDEYTPSVFLTPHGHVYDKVISNMEEIKARGGPVIAVTCEAGAHAAELADDVIHVPTVADFLQPIVTAIPLQLLAYHIALLRGCDVDKPRNLAKSVTVEQRAACARAGAGTLLDAIAAQAAIGRDRAAAPVRLQPQNSLQIAALRGALGVRWDSAWPSRNVLLTYRRASRPGAKAPRPSVKTLRRGDRGGVVMEEPLQPHAADARDVTGSIRQEAEMRSIEKRQARVHIRWMIRRDMPEVLAVESASFEFPWSEDDFVRCLRQRNCIGMVADCDDHVVGYMIYELHKNRLHLLNFAVAPEMRRRGVGAQMLSKLVGKLSQQRRSRILLEVRETNLDAQLFFRQEGFRAVSVLRNFYEDTPEDAYMMQYRYRPPVDGGAALPLDAITRKAG